MPTNNKTPNLQLNSWLGTDKPIRSDFVSDNTIIDTAIGNHLSDTNLHLTSEQKAWIAAPYKTGAYVGDGNASHTITFSFNPKAVFVFKKYSPLVYYDTTNQYMVYNCGFTLPANSSSTGVSLVAETLTLTQTQGTPSNGYFSNLNLLYGQYGYIAFK